MTLNYSVLAGLDLWIELLMFAFLMEKLCWSNFHSKNLHDIFIIPTTTPPKTSMTIENHHFLQEIHLQMVGLCSSQKKSNSPVHKRWKASGSWTASLPKSAYGSLRALIFLSYYMPLHLNNLWKMEVLRPKNIGYNLQKMKVKWVAPWWSWCRINRKSYFAWI